MMRIQQAIGIERRRAYPVLTDKPVYRDQTLADGIDGEEKTFERNGAEQGGTLWRNKTWSRDLITIQSQPCFGYGPDSLLSASDYDALRASGLELKLFCQRSRHHTKRSTGVHKKLDFFNASRRTGQMALYVEQSHIKSLLKNSLIVARPMNNATTLLGPKKVANLANLPAEQPMKCELIINLKNCQADRLDDSAVSAESGGQGNQRSEVSGQKSEGRYYE
jgi:hypothetical protein